MSITRQMKRNARILLRGNLAQGAAITLILFSVIALFTVLESICSLALDMAGISIAAQSAPGVGGLLSVLPTVSVWSVGVTAAFFLVGFFVIAPLLAGSKRWFYNLTAGDGQEVSAVFLYYSTAREFFKSTLLMLDIYLRSFFWTYVLILPGALLSATGGALLASRIELPNGRLLGTLGVVLGVSLTLLGFIFALFIMLRYFLAPYLFAEDSNIGVTKAIRTSIRYMHGSQLRLLGLLCSYILWAIASLLILPALYAFPYAESAMAIFARYTIEKGRIADFNAERQSPVNDFEAAPQAEAREAVLQEDEAPDAAESS